MRILALTGNSDRSESALIAGLAQNGNQVDLIGTPSDTLKKKLVQAGVNIIIHDCSSRIHPATIRLLRSKLQSKPFDLIHAFTSRMLSNALLASAKSGIKRVAYRGTSGHISKLDPAAWLSYLSPGVHRISCVSEAVRQYLLTRGIAENKLVTIHKGHEIGWYTANNAHASETTISGENDTTNERQQKFSSFGIPANAFVVTCTANMRPVKGVDILIESMAFLSQYPNIHFLLIGEVRDRRIEALLQKIPGNERIHLAGFRDDATAIVGLSDAFVMPSRNREGLPKAVIEAMSQSVTPIVTKVGGMPELVRDQIDGLVVAPCDALAIATAIERLYKNTELRSKLAVQARQRIIDDFNISKTVALTTKMYEELLAEK